MPEAPLVGDRALHQCPVEHPAHRVFELAQVLLPGPAVPHRRPLFLQKLAWNPRALLRRHLNPLPFRPAPRPRFVEEPALAERRAHQPQRPAAHRQHRPDRHVQFVVHPRRLVHQAFYLAMRGRPWPTVMRSSERRGVISAAVPEKNPSSAMYSSSRGTMVSTTGIPRSPASAMTLSRVMPGSTEAPSGGVRILPSRTTKTFSPEPSLT